MIDYGELREYVIEEADENQRIDLYLSLIDDTLSRSYIQKLIKEKMVFVNEKEVEILDSEFVLSGCSSSSWTSRWDFS